MSNRTHANRDDSDDEQPAGSWSDLFVGAAAAVAVAAGAFYVGKKVVDSFSTSQLVCSNISECQEIVNKIKNDVKEYPVIGLNCQWTQTFTSDYRNPIDLLQLASHKGNILLLKIKDSSSFPSELKSLLRDRSIIKAGIEGTKDALYLMNDYGLEVNGTFDLRFIEKKLGGKPEGLPKLARKYLNVDLDQSITLTKWNKNELDQQQLDYARQSVKASIDLFVLLMKKVLPNPTISTIFSYCEPDLDTRFVYYSQNY